MFLIYFYGSLLVVLTIYTIVERKKLKLFREIQKLRQEAKINHATRIGVLN